MPVVHIRDVSRATLERLKARARRNDRGLQAEPSGAMSRYVP
jgi:antitoxin FitA-like protein